MAMPCQTPYAGLVKTVLVYVLAARMPPWGKMIETAMETWDAEPLDATRTMFYVEQTAIPDTARIVSFPVKHELSDVGRKTILAFEHALSWPWDYMARTNSSCYVHKRLLFEHCQSLPEKGVIRGLVCGPTFVSGTDQPFVWGGGQFILSRDVVEALVANKEKWRHDLMEDVAMSTLALQCGFTLDSTGRTCSIDKHEDGWLLIAYNGKPGFRFTNWKDVAQADDQFFFRVKHDPDRSVDEYMMRQLKVHLLP